MQTLGVVTGVGVLRSGVTLLARILGNNGQPVTQATFSSITYTVRNLTTGTTVATGQSLTVANVVYDALQTADPRWDVDTSGYNFATTLPASTFTGYTVDASTYQVTPHRYQVDVLFTPVTGQPWVQPFQFVAVPVYTG